MRILFLTHSFNSLTQRLYVELTERGHEVSIEFDINDAVAEQAVDIFEPELIVAPFLKRAIPESIWKHQRCIIIHPGIKGDRGPSSLDWAIMRGESRWGVTCLQASAEMDAGDIWASVEFEMRAASKSSLYRNEITEAAVVGVLQTIKQIQVGGYKPEPLDYSRPEIQGQWHCLMTQADRAIDWQNDDSNSVLTKIRAADGMPGLCDRIGGRDYYLYNAYPEAVLNADCSAQPGQLLARRDGAICRATTDGAVWISHLKPAVPQDGEFNFKLPAVEVLGAVAEPLPELALLPQQIPEGQTWQQIRYRQQGEIGYLHFDFYNGAMSTSQCLRLRDAVEYAKAQSIRVLVMLGGEEFWSNGIHLNQIEAATSAADESWANINAMNDLCLTLIDTPKQYVIAAMQGNAGAGGVFMALTADKVVARDGVILNPHYKSMGNLYGSEYWSYLLPQRVGEQKTEQLTQNRLPISAAQAVQAGLIDEVVKTDRQGFVEAVRRQAEQLLDQDLEPQLESKRLKRQQDEAAKPLQHYRDEELARMKLNFYGFDPSYHVARYHFVEKLPKARTPSFLAHHRRLPAAKAV